MSDNFVIIPSTATVGDVFRALGAKANMGWYVIVRSPGRYGAIKAGELAKQALAGRDAPTAMQVRLDAFSTSPVTLSTIAPAKPPPSPQMMLATEFTRPPSLHYEAMRGGLDLAAKSNYDQLAQTAAASLKGVRAWAMPRNDFLVLPETSTAGDTFRALAAAPANLGWCVIVRYADHYGAIQTDQLIGQLIGQDLPAVLDKPLRDLNIPSLNAGPRDQLGDPLTLSQLTLALENDRPVLLYDPARTSADEWQAISTAEQLLGAATGQYKEKDSDLVLAQDDWTIGDVWRRLQATGRNQNCCVIVQRAEGYGAIQAGQLAQRAVQPKMQAALDTRLSNLSLPPIHTIANDKVGNWENLAGRTLILQDDQPLVLIQPDLSGPPTSFPVHGDGTASDRTAFDQLLRGVQPDAKRDVATKIVPPDPAARYVNTWFTDRIHGKAFARNQALARKRRYLLQLHIGPHTAESNVINPTAVDDKLPPIPDDGLRLRVKLFSQDFVIEKGKDTAELRLFKVGATERLHFAVTAPDRPGEARLRACIYYQNNLVQSILCRARIDEQETWQEDNGNWAEVEFGLSENLADLTQLEPRRVSVFVNESPGGTHMVGVVGTQTEGALNINVQQMTEAITEFREKLRGIIMDGQGNYLYNLKDNSGDQKKFEDDLKTLAYIGTNLFQSVFFQDATLDLMGQLSQALSEQPSAVIQIARLSSSFVFPWSGIYDRPVLIDRQKNRVCLEALKQSTPEAALGACGKCSHGDDPNVICLAGFWGFRHIVEQPLGSAENGKPSSVVREIKTSGQPQVSMNVYVGTDFQLRAEHQKRIKAQVEQKGGKMLEADDLAEVHQNLPQLQQLCYFYCHGGASKESINPWLTVGKEDRLMPPDLFGLGLHKAWRMKNIRPLVMINACHSIEFTPEKLSDFVSRFGAAGAAGVIGTEVSIFEPLAVEFGEGLIQAFLNGEPIGKAVQRLRWQLLLKRNVLGLVYTPYCYADLKLVA